MPSYKNMPIPISMVGNCPPHSILSAEALVLLHIFFPVTKEEIFEDFISNQHRSVWRVA